MTLGFGFYLLVDQFNLFLVNSKKNIKINSMFNIHMYCVNINEYLIWTFYPESLLLANNNMYKIWNIFEKLNFFKKPSDI